MSKNFDETELESCTKEELITKIRSLTSHNAQLKNILSKQVKRIKEIKETKQFDFTKCNFHRIALKLFYLGWDYKGFVVQEDTTETVEYHLFKALTKTKLIKDRESSNYHRCGRTDKGVSSFGQVISIDVRSNLKGNDEGEVEYCKVLNRVLPDEIQCVAWSPVDQKFSARFDCKARTYKYYFPKGKINIENMKLASEKLLGVHDFRNLCKMDVGNGVTEFVRNIYEINIKPISDKIDDNTIYIITIRAKAFLWHQIRCILGILFLIGQDKEECSLIDELLDVEKNPRKPDYVMASEVPLNLFTCEYDNISWRYDKESLENVIDKLNTIWTFLAIKETMVKDMIDNLKINFGDTNESKCLSDNLVPVTRRNYVPVMKRQTCNSLEDKIKHFSKRKKLK